MMEDQDKHNSIKVLRDTENWVIWKTKDKIWTYTVTLKRETDRKIEKRSPKGSEGVYRGKKNSDFRGKGLIGGGKT